MNYQETIEYLFSALPMYQNIGQAAYKAKLDNAHKLDACFKYPHQSFKSIHVGGTNGKGSTSHMLAAVLQSAGYKVGLYTSPHLIDFRERIRVNGCPVTEQFVIEFTEKHQSTFEQIQPSFFEMTVFMAFEYFAREKVDYAIVEVGLGGRLDATNVITPLVSVITNIGLDHTQFLGDTLTSIAHEKAGIIKPGVPVVVGETLSETAHVFSQKAQAEGCPLWFADAYFKTDYALQDAQLNASWHFTTCSYWPFTTLTTDLKGAYQKKNLATVLMTLRILRQLQCCTIREEHIRDGLKQVAALTGLQGRWQILGTNPLQIGDVAHNADGFREVFKQLESTPYKKLRMVLGFVNDKDLAPILQLLPREASYYLCEPKVIRALKKETLEKYFRAEALNFTTFQHAPEAAIAAVNESDSSDLIFIGGSTFVVADYLASKKV